MHLLTRVIVFLFCLSVAATVDAQVKYSTTKGELSFASKAELELIQARSSETQGLIDPVTNQFAFSVAITSFKGFNSDLQRQHFNDNYMESAKYPRATFAGKIIEQVNYDKDSIYIVRAKGELDIHGQKQSRIIRSRVTVRNKTLVIESDFTVPLADHNISIPKIVNQKIASEIEVSLRATLQRQ
jgi:polyisoprenoid-binding protein YceI